MYQPFESGGREKPTETVGLDASYWNVALVVLTVLPALSMQLPLTVVLGASGPEFVRPVHAEREAGEGVSDKRDCDGWLYQP